MKLFRSRRRAKLAGLLVLLAIFLIRPGANRLRSRIVGSISMALGRPVDVASVQFHLLPQPGFDLYNFVVHDDPAFGAEPMLRAGEVSASLRVMPLLRGRLEIARLSLTEPSLNLVRNPAGHWNLENLLERTARIQVAPTAKAKSESRPGFPYIEASGGRINFKLGAEKKPYALTDADFSLWQDSENAWGMRLKARPVRTDFNLTDTGLLRVAGSWQRAANLRDTPLRFTFLWGRAQLGQLSKLVSGNDKGWRGTWKLSSALAGTPANLSVKADVLAEDFHRYDILGGGPLRLAMKCDAHYSSVEQILSAIKCRAPVSDGTISIDGSVALGSRGYDLVVAAQKVPMQALVALARHTKQGIPDDLLAQGHLDAEMQLRRASNGSASSVAWQGKGETTGLHVRSNQTNTDLALDSIPFSLSSAGDTNPRRNAGQSAAKMTRSAEPHLEVGPFHASLGRPAPIRVEGWISRLGYNFEIQGEAQLQKLLQTARAAGIQALATTADGSARVDLQIAGDWAGFAPPHITGKAQLHAVRAQVHGMNAPVEIVSANLTLAPDEIHAQNLAATVAGTSWQGSLSLPRPCATADSCTIRFDLHADEIAVDRLNQLLNPKARQEPWYRFLSSPDAAAPPYLLSINAEGKLTANQVDIHRLIANRVSANVQLRNGKLRLSNLRGDVLGGRHSGEWAADFMAKPPQYSGSGMLERVSLGQFAQLMSDSWITGTTTASYRASASGLTGAELLASATSALRVEARDGTLPHIVLAEQSAPLQMRRFDAHLLLHDRKFEIENGRLETAAGIYQVSGTASLNRILDLQLRRKGATGFNIAGPLTEPRVTQSLTPETRAALKP